MENFIEYENAGKPWESNEDNQLIKEYNIDMLNLLDICKKHKRMPGGIMSRLKHHNLITHGYNVRGYTEYLKSDLYKEILEQKKGKRGETKIYRNICVKSDDIPVIKTNTIESIDNIPTRLQLKQIPSDIKQLKKDVKEIKENIKQILEMMNAIYEYENNNTE